MSENGRAAGLRRLGVILRWIVLPGAFALSFVAAWVFSWLVQAQLGPLPTVVGACSFATTRAVAFVYAASWIAPSHQANAALVTGTVMFCIHGLAILMQLGTPVHDPTWYPAMVTGLLAYAGMVTYVFTASDEWGRER